MEKRKKLEEKQKKEMEEKERRNMRARSAYHAKIAQALVSFPD